MESIDKIKTNAVLAINIFYIVSQSASAFYNIIFTPGGDQDFLYLGFGQLVLIFSSFVSLYFVIVRNNLEISAIVLAVITAISLLVAVIAIKGQFNVYIFVVLYAVFCFSFLRMRWAFLAYSIVSSAVIFLSVFVHNDPSETIFNLVFALIAAGGILGAYSISNRNLIKKLLLLSRTDALTGLLNRATFREIAAQEIVDGAQIARPLVIMLGDIDYFKRINETLGHDAGDDLLKSVANILTGQVDDTGSVARWGGTEFALLLPGMSSEDATGIADQLLSSIRSSGHGKAGRASMSFGLTEHIEGEDVATTLKRVAMALQESRNNGRDQYCVK